MARQTGRKMKSPLTDFLEENFCLVKEQSNSPGFASG
jgi:hypothetical protein